MNFFIIVLLSGSVNGAEEYFIVTDPTFETMEQCADYGVNKQSSVLQGMYNATGRTNWDTIACVDKERLQYMLRNIKPEGTDA